METKHTQGPWSLDEDGRTVYSAIGSEIAVVSLRPKEVIEGGKYLDRKHFNAKLIAAAPDLLDVLDSTYQLMIVLGVDPTHPNMVAMNAVIKKATE